MNTVSAQKTNNLDFMSVDGVEQVMTTCQNAIDIGADSVTDLSLICGTSNDLNGSNVTVCGGASTSYLGGNEALYRYVPSQNGYATISYSGVSWTGIFVYENCPIDGTCVGSASSSSSSSNSYSFNATAGTEYYIMIDTWPTPQSPCPDTMSIELESGCSGEPTGGSITISPASGEVGNNTFTVSGSSGQSVNCGYTKCNC